MFRYCLLFLALFVFAQILYSQTDSKFLQTQWTTENGLPQNSVSAIAQTPEGYIWVGTFGGLARFDGIHFKIYTTSNTPEIKSNRITALTTDKEGTLWIGTERGEIVIYKDRKFKLIDDGKEIKNKTIGNLYADKNGVVWANNAFSLRHCTIEKCIDDKNQKAVSKVSYDSEGNLWKIQDQKLFKFINDKFVQIKLNYEITNSIESNHSGGLWIFHQDTLTLYKNGVAEDFIKINRKDESYAMKSMPDGTFWFNYGNDLYRIKNDEIEQYKISNVSNITANQIFIDREGSIWLGRIGEGLIQLLDHRVQTLTFEGTINNKIIKGIAINSIAEDKEGNMWFASNPFLFRLFNGKIEQMTKSANFGSLLVDSQKKLWVVTSFGLRSYENSKFTTHKEISWEDEVSASSLFEDSEKNLWYGCNDCGIFVAYKEKIIARYSTENGLVGNTADFITETRDGAIWIGTTAGLSRLQDGKFTNWTTENGLSNDYVRAIYEDQDGTIWIGTYGGGLNRYKDGIFTHITTNHGLFDDIVSQILVDDNDNFWFLGNRGIFSVSRKMLNDFADKKINNIYCSAFTTKDGMITSEGNGGYQNAGIRSTDGKLWFPMIQGVVIIDPKQETMLPPKPLIDEVLLDKKLVDTNKKIEINPGNESLEIIYTGLNFRKPEQIRFRYKLDGLDKNWTEAGTRRLANYPYLPSGEFTFQLQAANADGNWSQEIDGFKIIVHPPFYRTWWFFILIWLIFFTALISLFKYKNLLFAKEKAKQEEFTRRLINAQENERKRIASEIHDSLGQQLLVIKNWATYCLQKSRKLSEMRLPIQQINASAEESLQEVRTMAKMLSPYHLDKVGVSNTIRFMIKQVAESSEINFETEIDDIDGILSKENDINLYRIVQESISNIIKHSQASEAKIIIKKSENLIKLRVLDNGIGVYTNNYEYENFGIGLHGIAERAKMLGGNFVYESVETKGTKLKIDIELNEKHASD
jgi:signal transduction histidine kinase/ligand-binding sensor domain-containing protein